MTDIDENDNEKDINDDFYRSITIEHLSLFRMIGVLPYLVADEPNDLRRRLKSWISTVCCHSSSIIYYTMHFAYGLRMLLDSRLEIDLVCDLVIVQGMSTRLLMLSLQRDNLLKLTRYCRKLWDSFVCNSEIERSIIRGFERKAYYVQQFFYISGALAFLFYFTVAQFVRVPIISQDNNVTYVRMLPLKFYVDVYEEPWYSLVTIFQAIVCLVMALILVGIETICPFLIMMACGYLRSVNNRLTSMAVDQHHDHYNEQIADKLVLDELIVCVKFHQRSLDFCEKIGRFTRDLFMVQISCTLYNMSLIGIKMFMGNDNLFKNITILLINLAQFFSCQWISQYLVDESEAIANAAYNVTMTHRHFDAKANRILLLMMLRADKPVQLTASGIVRLSHESFQKMMLNAFSLFTVLRNFT